MQQQSEQEFIPFFSLYGDDEPWPAPEPLHCEAIQARSALHNWKIRPHRHRNLHQMIFVKSGGGSMTVEDSTRQLTPPGTH